ncbi:MAG: Holliday junction resolvase RuvX [Terriglobales bacterium]
MQRILALDLGLRRIGVAVSDPLRLTAQGLATLQRRNRGADLAALQALAQAHAAGMWLLGLPRLMSGEEGRQAGIVRAWGDALHRHTHLPVEYWDERLTTVEAERVLRSASSSRAQTRRAVDRLAAVILLQSYLDAASLGSCQEHRGEPL